MLNGENKKSISVESLLHRDMALGIAEYFK